MPSANPAPLGLCGFAFTTWLLSMINAGWFPAANMPMVLSSALVFGGGAQFLAGLLEYPRGNSFGVLAFCGYGCFWLIYAIFVLMHPAGMSAAFVAWFLLLWGIFTAGLLAASLTHARVIQLLFAALTATFLLLSYSEFVQSPGVHLVAGYLGLITALIAFYAAMGQIINDSHGRTVLPLGEKNS